MAERMIYFGFPFFHHIPRELFNLGQALKGAFHKRFMIRYWNFDPFLLAELV